MRALFVVHEERRGQYAGQRTYVLGAVMPISEEERNDPELNAFWSATPNGQLTISITNPDAYLEIGRRYYLDFTPHPSEPIVS